MWGYFEGVGGRSNSQTTVCVYGLTSSGDNGQDIPIIVDIDRIVQIVCEIN